MRKYSLGRVKNKCLKCEIYFHSIFTCNQGWSEKTRPEKPTKKNQKKTHEKTHWVFSKSGFFQFSFLILKYQP